MELLNAINQKYAVNKTRAEVRKRGLKGVKLNISKDLENYITRQAATIGRKASLVTGKLERSDWVPHLPEAKGNCLGILPSKLNNNLNNLSYDCRCSIFPDGKTIAIGNNNRVEKWNITNLTRIWQSKNHRHAYDISISRDGSRVAVGFSGGNLQILDGATGHCILKFNGQHPSHMMDVCLSPDGKKLVSFGHWQDLAVRIWDATSGECVKILDNYSRLWFGFKYSPDSQFIALPTNEGKVGIWNSVTGNLVKQHPYYFNVVCWSPDSRNILTSSGTTIVMLDAFSGDILRRFEGHTRTIRGLDWLPNSHLLASYSDDKTLRIWDTDSGKELIQFSFPEKWTPYSTAHVTWSPQGNYLISSHEDNVSRETIWRFWDTRHLLKSQTFTTFDPSPTQLFPGYSSLLPTAIAQMHRLGIYPPLSLVQDLLDLTGGHTVNNSLTQLAQDPSTGIPDLIVLRWSAPARIGLIALLLHNIPFPDWEPPSSISPREISAALQAALKGEPIEPEAPPPPISLLREAGKLIDEKLLSLLTILGAKAVETEPALPLRLLSRVPDLPALSSLQRQLLGVRVCFGNRSGRSIGNAPGAERGQVSGVEASSKTDWISLLPSQLALPQPVVEYRHHRGELLFRTRELAEPPRLRPTVLLLDVTPPAFGPVEAITRIAAFAVANSLRQANMPVVLINTGEEQDRILQLDNPENLVEIWTERSLAPANEVRTLKLANAVRTNLKVESGQEPMILLLTQPWFGAEKNMPRVSGLRGLFIQYPNMDVKPTIADVCERYETLAAGHTAELGQILGYLMG